MLEERELGNGLGASVKRQKSQHQLRENQLETDYQKGDQILETQEVKMCDPHDSNGETLGPSGLFLNNDSSQPSQFNSSSNIIKISGMGEEQKDDHIYHSYTYENNGGQADSMENANKNEMNKQECLSKKSESNSTSQIDHNEGGRDEQSHSDSYLSEVDNEDVQLDDIRLDDV